MSFKPEISDGILFNEALAMLPADPVQSADERSLEARECRRAYKNVVAELLERHHWNLASKRAALAVVTNDRSDEWAFAYAKPSDMAYPVMLIPAQGGGVGGWVMRDYAYWIGSRKVFMQVGKIIYSSIEAARLDYTSFDITEGDFTVGLKKSVVEHLAARICMAVTKDATRERTLAGMAEFNLMRTIASDLNRNQPTYGDRPTESEIARGAGIDLNLIGTGRAIDPIAYPSNTGT